jgi:trk system potassium uptake protein TrkH
MALFGVNFTVYFLLLMGKFRQALRGEELGLYLTIMLGAMAIITVDVLPLYGGSIRSALHDAAFAVSSIMTTTGFATADFNSWPALSKTLLVLLMFVGACAGSTGGGVKVARVLLLMKAGRRNVKRMLRPRSVSQVHMDGGTVSEEVVQNTYSYLALYMGIMVLSVFLIALDEFSLETNATAVVACLNNIGPGLDMVGPMGSYANFSWHSKLVLSFDMLAGRLELFPMIMLFVPLSWKRT